MKRSSAFEGKRGTRPGFVLVGTTPLQAICSVIHTVSRLRAFRGIDTISALGIHLEVGDWTRFNHPKHVAAYLGLVPRRDQSGQTDKQLGITKAGDGLVRTLLVQGAHRILGPFGEDSALRRHGLHLAARGGKASKKRAVIAVARKLAVLLHRMWVTGEAYEPLRAARPA